MKILGKLKLAAISAFVVLGMSSCLKTDDPDFAIWPQYAYIFQEGYGDAVRFTPAIYLQGNRPIKSATCTFDKKSFSFKSVPNRGGYEMEINNDMPSYIDTISTWTCPIQATSAEETPESAPYPGSFKECKPLGQFSVTELKYTASGNKFTGKWNKVENATDYYLVYKMQNSDMWWTLGKFSAGSEESTWSFTLNGSFEKGETYQIAVGAMNSSFLSVSGQMRITGGSDGEL